MDSISNGMNPVVHFEMPARDKKRMSEFYSKAFGWQMEQMGPEMADYVVVTTSERGENGFPKEPGRINGGFFTRTKEVDAPSIVIAVPDIREAMKKVAEAGGTVVGGKNPGEPDDIPGIGLYCTFVDSEGNRASMLEPKGM